MHRIATQPGGWDPNESGVILVEQDPAPLILLTAADTDIQTLAAARSRLPEDFPELRALNLLNLQQNLSIDQYAETVLSQAQGILVRLLGGRAYWSYGIEVVTELARTTGAQLICLPGDDRPDWDLIQHSTLDLAQVDRVWRYFLEGGIENLGQALCLWSNLILGTAYAVQAPRSLPRIGLYTPPDCGSLPLDWPGVGILMYRAHVISGNTAPVDALCQDLIRRHLRPKCLYTYGLKEPELIPELRRQFKHQVEIVIATTSFSLARPDEETAGASIWRELDRPVLQGILSGGSESGWQDSTQGLSARDLAMNVALPEVEGRVITRAISFKAQQVADPRLQTDVVIYRPQPDRVAFLGELIHNWVILRQLPPADRKIALILANYPNRDGRLANGVGLDTPASCVQLLKALQQAGYTLSSIPGSSQGLMDALTQGITNDPVGQSRASAQGLSGERYGEFFRSLPDPVQAAVIERWGEPPSGSTPIPVAGLQLGHVFVGIQPSRGYDQDPSLSYHAPDLVPPHRYLAFYAWLRLEFGAHGLVHLGKHGNLEWLPGKGIALSSNCFPEIALGPLPHFYPFIVNDPGEGSQAKRRAQAVILDHLTPPLTRAELYGPLLQLERLLDELAEAQGLDPRRAEAIKIQICELVIQENLVTDLEDLQDLQDLKRQDLTDPVQGDPRPDQPELFNRLDGYLCELKEAQIRDGLHILGQMPTDQPGIDLIRALARYPGGGQQGLTQAIAQDWGLSFDPLTVDLGRPLE